MAAAKSTPKSPFEAAQIVYSTLEPLDEETRQRVVVSALSLLGMDTPWAVSASPTFAGDLTPPSAEHAPLPSGTRPLSPVELIQLKQPSTNAQRFALFAYYREKVEGKPRFSRSDLRDYFAKARLTPPQNYDRDFKAAVQLGYIHEDGAESYLTSKGLEAVEAGFGGSAGPRAASATRPRRKKRVSRKRSARRGHNSARRR